MYVMWRSWKMWCFRCWPLSQLNLPGRCSAMHKLFYFHFMIRLDRGPRYHHVTILLPTSSHLSSIGGTPRCTEDFFVLFCSVYHVLCLSSQYQIPIRTKSSPSSIMRSLIALFIYIYTFNAAGTRAIPRIIKRIYDH